MDVFITWCNTNQGFLTFILSICTIGISAFALFQTVFATKKQNDIALYEKRYDIFKITKDFINEVCVSNFNNDDIYNFKYKTQPVSFLFKEDIKDFIKDIHFKALELDTWNTMRVFESDEQHSDIIHRTTEHKIWFGKQRDDLEEKFEDYLKLK
jgi:hypothetical protein